MNGTMNGLTIDEVQLFWREHPQYIPDSDHERFIRLGPNPRYIEFPWSYACYRAFQPRKMLECGSSHVDRNYFKIYWDLILEQGEPYGVDITPLLPDRYSASVSADRLKRFKTSVGDLRKLPFQDDFFDMIFCISTLEHVGFEIGKAPTAESPNAIDRNVSYPADPNQHQEDSRALRELLRTLSRSGRLVLTVPFEASARYWHHTDSMGFTATEIVFDAHRLETLVERAGARVQWRQFYYEAPEGGWKQASETFPTDVKQGLACLLIEKN